MNSHKNLDIQNGEKQQQSGESFPLNLKYLLLV